MPVPPFAVPQDAMHLLDGVRPWNPPADLKQADRLPVRSDLADQNVLRAGPAKPVLPNPVAHLMRHHSLEDPLGRVKHPPADPDAIKVVVVAGCHLAIDDDNAWNRLRTTPTPDAPVRIGRRHLLHDGAEGRHSRRLVRGPRQQARARSKGQRNEAGQQYGSDRPTHRSLLSPWRVQGVLPGGRRAGLALEVEGPFAWFRRIRHRGPNRLARLA